MAWKRSLVTVVASVAMIPPGAGACGRSAENSGTAPVALMNDVLHEDLTPQKLQKLIDALPEDPHDYKDPAIDWEIHEH